MRFLDGLLIALLRGRALKKAARTQFVDSTVKEDEIRYHALSVAAHELSQWIAAGPRPKEAGSAICLWKAAVESVSHPPKDIGAPAFEGREGAVFEALLKLRADWADLR